MERIFTRRPGPPASWSARSQHVGGTCPEQVPNFRDASKGPSPEQIPACRNASNGFTLVEILVVLAVLSILSLAALPYAKISIQREREWELRRDLREIRSALDAFHEDWKSGRIPASSREASSDGWPRNLAVLVAGVEQPGPLGTRRYFLRRLPRDPLADPALQPEDSWGKRSYRDRPGTRIWGGQDVYDVCSKAEGEALDGTRYTDW